MEHTEQIEKFANEALVRYELAEAGWTFRWDRARRRFGSCDYGRQQITLSIHLAKINTLAQCMDTVLHEVAHALAGQAAGHGPAWKEACRRVGAQPERCYTTAQVKQPPSKYIRYCPNCGHATPIFRRSRKLYACGKCCKKYNGGKFSSKFLLKTVERSKYTPVTREV
ncbi:MAG: SprT-like domain-containing protein [Bacteroidota bacterium]